MNVSHSNRNVRLNVNLTGIACVPLTVHVSAADGQAVVRLAVALVGRVGCRQVQVPRSQQGKGVARGRAQLLGAGAKPNEAVFLEVGRQDITIHFNSI